MVNLDFVWGNMLDLFMQSFLGHLVEHEVFRRRGETTREKHKKKSSPGIQRPTGDDHMKSPTHGVAAYSVQTSLLLKI